MVVWSSASGYLRDDFIRPFIRSFSSSAPVSVCFSSLSGFGKRARGTVRIRLCGSGDVCLYGRAIALVRERGVVVVILCYTVAFWYSAKRFKKKTINKKGAITSPPDTEPRSISLSFFGGLGSAIMDPPIAG